MADDAIMKIHEIFQEFCKCAFVGAEDIWSH